MKQLTEIVENFFGNVGADIQSEISNIFSIKSMSEYYHSKPIAKLKYVEDKSAILDSLHAGDVICIDINNHPNLNMVTYIQKQDTGKFREKITGSWGKGRYGTSYTSTGVLRVVMDELAPYTTWDRNNSLVIKTTLIKK